MTCIQEYEILESLRLMRLHLSVWNSSTWGEVACLVAKMQDQLTWDKGIHKQNDNHLYWANPMVGLREFNTVHHMRIIWVCPAGIWWVTASILEHINTIAISVVYNKVPVPFLILRGHKVHASLPHFFCLSCFPFFYIKQYSLCYNLGHKTANNWYVLLC